MPAIKVEDGPTDMSRAIEISRPGASMQVVSDARKEITGALP